MRRKPYTEIGIRRIPCYRCGAPSVHQWQVCADKNTYRGLCVPCDFGLNKAVMEYMGRPGWQKKVRAYAARLGISAKQ